MSSGLAVAMLGLLGGGLLQAQELRVPAPHRHAPVNVLRTHEDGTSDSTNWSGYAVTATNGSVTAVTGSWKIPSVTCSPTTTAALAAQYSSFWVGIDGWTSKTVEQTGTDSDCASGKPNYYAWYEFYPQGSYFAGSLTNLSPGDLMTASVTYNTNGTFTTTIQDVTKKLTFTTTLTPNKTTGTPSRNSAEWIAEAPAGSKGILPLADFQLVDFGDDYTSVAKTCSATISGKTNVIGLFSAASIQEATMVTETGSKPMAVPSALTPDGSSFDVTWKNVGP